MQDEVTAVVGCYTSASRIACEPVVEENDSLLIYPPFYEGEKPSENVVYTGAVPNQQGDIFIPWLAENVGKKFFLLGTDTVYAQLINSQCREALAEVGGEVVGEETYASVMLLANALEKADDYSAESIIKAMDGISFDAPEGTITFDKDTNYMYLRGRIAKVNSEGKFEVVYESPDLIKPEPRLKSYLQGVAA